MNLDQLFIYPVEIDKREYSLVIRDGVLQSRTDTGYLGEYQIVAKKGNEVFPIKFGDDLKT